MAKRIHTATKRFNTDEVQGEGSFVVLKSLTVGEIRKWRNDARKEDADVVEGTLKVLTKQLVEWNWVDDDGKPLPTTAKGMDALYEAEAEYLAKLLVGGDEEGLKN